MSPQVRLARVREWAVPDETTALPDFFHRDLAYLWALAVSDPATLSPVWQSRIDRWKRLLVWWLLGDITEDEVPIHPPFLDYVPIDVRNGRPVLEQVTWLLRQPAAGPPLPIGVLSPLVVLRPSPEYDRRHEVWSQPPPPWEDPRWADVCADLRDVLAAFLRTVTAGSSAHQHALRLQAIIKTHFEHQPRNPIPVARQPRSLTLRHWRTLEAFALSVNRAGGLQGLPIQEPPECGTCHELQLPLTLEIRPGEEPEPVKCRCGAVVSLPLLAFFATWFKRSESAQPTLAIWEDRALFWAGTGPAVPPKPRVERDRVVFTYPRTLPRIAMREQAGDRSVTLHIAGLPGPAPVELLALKDVLFPKPIWPGEGRVAEGITVSPVRPAYLPLLSEVPIWHAVAQGGHSAVLRLAGLPTSVRVDFAEGVDTLPDAALAVFPDPQVVGSTWSWYRMHAGSALDLQAAETRRVHGGFVESVAGLPRHVVLSRDSSTGCTLALDRDRLLRAGVGLARVEMGIDLGTTNSVVYSARQAQGIAEETAFEPHRLRGRVLWAVRPLTTQGEAMFLDRLFPGTGSTDPATVPSELCAHDLIPWAVSPCCAVGIQSMFKAQSGAEGVRRRYLTELVCHALVDVIGRLASPPTSLDIHAAFTYPLSLTPNGQSEFKRMVSGVFDDIRSRLPLAPGSEPQFLDESTAGILSVGQPQADELLLAADLGGGTLDVSLGRGSRDARDQIGSLDAGGNYLLRSIAEGDDDLRSLQVAIRARPDEASARLSRSTAKRLLERYTGWLLVFLETMVASHARRRQIAAGEVLRVKLYLLGNGWGFYRFLANPDDDLDRVWTESIRGLVRKVEADLSRLLGSTIIIEWIRGDRPPKHAVAHGALKAVQTGDDSSAHAVMALPAGIGLSVNTAGQPFSLQWHELFGPATDRNPNLRGREIDDTVRFDFAELETRLEGATVLTGSQNARDQDVVIRQGLIASGNRCGGLPPTGYFRGPLQLTLEHWTRRLPN